MNLGHSIGERVVDNYGDFTLFFSDKGRNCTRQIPTFGNLMKLCHSGTRLSQAPAMSPLYVGTERAPSGHNDLGVKVGLARIFHE